ncbi:hypothetical protein D1007_31951 [Hordeum vulgare]|nr:hypothetical protein D1007_31951 [Hordeum vulgare]
MTGEEEVDLMRWVMEDSVHTHGEAQWEGLEMMMALLGIGDVAIPELDMAVKEVVNKESFMKMVSGVSVINRTPVNVASNTKRKEGP